MNARALLVAGCLACATSLCLADPAVNTLNQEELDDGWILLFDGETTFGWKAAGEVNWKAADGMISATEGKQSLLHTTTQFADYVLKVDFRSTPATNSGVFLRTPAEPKDAAVDCYELNIAAPELTPFFTGSFVNRQKATPTPESTEWRSFTVKAEGAHFTVSLDGKQVLDYVDPRPVGRGFIGLQFNKGPIQFRNIKLKPLSLQPIFNGQDLTGWKPTPGNMSEFSVTPEGALRIKNGKGQLEWQSQVADFVMQLECFSNGVMLNSGIFFRNLPGQMWQGYESQIQNGHFGDRTKPIDFGTGAFYRRQKARKVVPDDFKWFHKTLIADGDHMATWVDGYQVTDWTDTRPANANARDGLKLEAGTIAIQGHDPKTDLSFRKLRLVELPPKK